MRINCPYCGTRDHFEFICISKRSLDYPGLDAGEEEWARAVFDRENPRGVQKEAWHHAGGCRTWLVIERDTSTHEILSVVPSHHGIQKILKVEE